MKGIKIIEERPIIQPELCEKIVKIFAKRKLKITPQQARHLWDLQSVEKGMGWITSPSLTDKEVFESFKPYYFLND